MKLRLSLALALPLSLALATGIAHGQAAVDGAFARATAGKQANGAAYLQLSAKSDDALLSASAPVAAKTEIHTMSMEGDVMKMRALDKLEIKGGEKIAMQPGAGAHIMLMGLKQPLKAGETFPLTLNFRKAGKVTVEVTVKELAMQGKGGNAHDHDSHDHHHHD
jgi:copper(I)-binding protein